MTHQWAFVASIPIGIAQVASAPSARAWLAAAIYAVSVAALFGSSALYHLAAMYVAVLHQFQDPPTGFARGEKLVMNQGAPAGVRGLQFYPATDRSLATWLWESDSVEAVQEYVDSTLGDSSVNTCWQVDTNWRSPSGRSGSRRPRRSGHRHGSGPIQAAPRATKTAVGESINIDRPDQRGGEPSGRQPLLSRLTVNGAERDYELDDKRACGRVDPARAAVP